MTHHMVRHGAPPRVNYFHRIFLQSVTTHQNVRHGGPWYFLYSASWRTISCVTTDNLGGPASWRTGWSVTTLRWHLLMPWHPLASVTTHRTVRHDAPMASPQLSQGNPWRASRRTGRCVMTDPSVPAVPWRPVPCVTTHQFVRHDAPHADCLFCPNSKSDFRRFFNDWSWNYSTIITRSLQSSNDRFSSDFTCDFHRIRFRSPISMLTGTNLDNPCVYPIHDYDSTLESQRSLWYHWRGIDPAPGPRSGLWARSVSPKPEITPWLRGYDA